MAFLSAAENHAHERPDRVEALETHTSWAFLTERIGYKLKEPVRQPVIDLRSLGGRREGGSTDLFP